MDENSVNDVAQNLLGPAEPYVQIPETTVQPSVDELRAAQNPAYQFLQNHGQTVDATQQGLTVPQMLAPNNGQVQLPAMQQEQLMQGTPASPSSMAKLGNAKLQASDFAPDTRAKSSASSTAVPGFDMENLGLRAAERAAQEKMLAEQKEYETKERLIKDQVAAAQARETQIKQIGDTALVDYQNVAKELNDFKFKDYWENKSTGQKVMAGIAIALGGIGGAFTGKGDNKALEIINKAIEQDVNLQKLNFDRLRQKGETSKSLYATMMSKYNNEALAQAATEAALLNLSSNRLTAIGSKYDNQMTQAKLKMMQGQLAQTHAEKVQKLQLAAIANGAGQGADLKNLTPQQVALIGSSYDKTFPERYVPGYGPAVNATSATEFNKYRAEVEPAIAGTKRVLEYSKNLNRLSPEQRAQVATELQALVGQLRLPFVGPGAMTDKEYERLADTIGNPNKLATMPSWQKVKLQTVLKKLTTDMNIRAKQAGLNTPTGNVKNENPF
jgi:hypothetical protein